MIYLELSDVLDLHDRVIAQSGGASGVRDPGLLDSAIVQPQMAFGGVDLYPTIAEKAAALGFSLVLNHPFFDGNKRVGHLAMDTFLISNGYELIASTDDQEAVILSVAAGMMRRDQFTDWVRQHLALRSTP